MFKLKIENQARDDHQVTLIVEFEAGVLERYKQQAAREFSRKMKIPGFRPGKAPYQVIVRQVGEAELTEHALEHLVDEKYPAVIEEFWNPTLRVGPIGESFQHGAARLGICGSARASGHPGRLCRDPAPL